MKFRGHETFFVRKGWINKGIKNVVKDSAVFMGNSGNPMDVLGIGSNMVKSLRYWLQAFSLTQESTSGKREQFITPFGSVIYKYDPYVEEMGTLWLLHYKLSINKKDATAWYYFFNEFKMTEFDRDDFIKQLSSYIRMNGEQVSERSLEDDYNCIINTYLPRIKSSPEKVLPESNIDCPLGELGLVDIANRKTKTYVKRSPQKNLIPPLVLLAVIIEQAAGKKEVRISDLQTESCNVGKVFNIDIIVLTTLLYDLEQKGLLKVIRTAGLDVIRLDTSMTFEECVEEYYRTMNSK